MIGPEEEGPRPPQGGHFSDAVSFSFADPSARLYGLVRLGLGGAGDQASALALLFAGAEPVAARVQGGEPVVGTPWDDVSVAGVRARTVDPLHAWTVELAAQDAAFSLDFHAVSGPLDLGPARVGRASGVQGYEQVCRVEGEVSVHGSARTLTCLGQRGHGWGPSPWSRIELARTVSAWLDGRRGVALAAVRPAGGGDHGEEAVTAFLVDGEDGEGDAVEVAEPRLSTTYDVEGRQRRAGLELWMHEDDELPRRLAGEVACGTSLELGRLRLDCSFFHWRMEGRTGAGRYDVLRPA